MIIDRYMSVNWIKPVLGSISIFLVLFLLIDFFGLMGQILEHQPGTSVVISYLLYRTGYGIFFLTPMALLIGGFWTTFGLRKNNEWTICQLTGTSSANILRAPITALVILTVLMIIANCLIMPTIAQNVEILDDYTLKNRSKPTPVFRHIHTKLPDGRTVKIGRFDPGQATIRNITVSKKKGTKIVLRWDSPSGIYTPGSGWTLKNVTVRTIGSSGDVTTSRAREKLIPLAPPEILSVVTKLNSRSNELDPIQYSFEDLYTSINYNTKRGLNTTEERILLHWKFGFPLTNSVLGLIGLMVGLRTKLSRAGGVGLCLLLGLGYWIFFSFSVSWGKVTGPLLGSLNIVPVIFVYGPAIVSLAGAYTVWVSFSEQY
ncbi:MAG: LptF/LptG family permease [bacterium]